MRSLIPPFIVMTAAMVLAAPTTANSLAVTTVNGNIHGGICPNMGANYFLSIPFAEPPLGDLRFASPQPYKKTFTDLNATSTAPSCIQFDQDLSAGSIQSEDCLYLNVWAPANISALKPLPVKVWLYGGRNEADTISDPLYNGCDSAVDAVIVSVNYRLGPLGWLALEDAGLTGNYGLQDQILGLRWVQENIQAFGGDPSKVLLFGQSAGAIDAFVISTSPEALSLMKAVALESADGSYIATLSEAAEWNRLFVMDLNCTSPATNLSASAIQTCLHSLPVSQINTAASTLSASTNPNSIPQVGTPYNNHGRGNAWGPLVDGTLVARPPAQAGSRVPLIIGSNSQDGTLYILAAYGSQLLALSAADYDDFLAHNFGPYAPLVNQTYPLALFNATPYPAYEAISTVFTHARLRCFGRMGAVLSSSGENGVGAYAYSFNHAPSCDWEEAIPDKEVLLELLGATHSAEVPFVFGHTRGLPAPSGNCNLTGAEVAMSEWMVDAWTSMARKGEPGGGWPAYEDDGERSGVNFGDEAVVGEIDYSMCDFWDPLWEKMAGS